MPRKITVPQWQNIQAGESVPNGFTGYLTAPSEPGSYTLYELVNDNNTHAGWEWEKEAT